MQPGAVQRQLTGDCKVLLQLDELNSTITPTIVGSDWSILNIQNPTWVGGSEQGLHSSTAYSLPRSTIATWKSDFWNPLTPWTHRNGTSQEIRLPTGHREQRTEERDGSVRRSRSGSRGRDRYKRTDDRPVIGGAVVADLYHQSTNWSTPDPATKNLAAWWPPKSTYNPRSAEKLYSLVITLTPYMWRVPKDNDPETPTPNPGRVFGLFLE